MTPMLPFHDAAPLAGGAGVEGAWNAPKSTRLPLRPPTPRNAPAGTSEQAADRIRGHAAALRDRVYAFIASRGARGATDDEGEAALNIKCQTYTPRRGELVKLGLVVDSGARRKTVSGRPAAVWVTPAHAGAAEGGVQ